MPWSIGPERGTRYGYASLRAGRRARERAPFGLGAFGQDYGPVAPYPLPMNTRLRPIAPVGTAMWQDPMMPNVGPYFGATGGCSCKH